MTPEEEELLRLKTKREAEAQAARVRQEKAQAEQTQAAAEDQAIAQELRDKGPSFQAISAEPKRQEGIISQVGNFIEDVITGDWISNAANAINPNIPDAEELDRRNLLRAQQVEDEGNVLEKTAFGLATNLEAVAGGIKAAPMLPISLAAAVTGQKAEWNEAPEIVKRSPLSKAIYDVTKVVAPTLVLGLITRGAGVPLGVKGTLLAESAIETVAMQNPDDYILSRTAAKSVGELVNSMGGDGEQVTKNLIEGNGLGYRAVGLAAGFLHNLGINIAASKIINKIAEGLGIKPPINPDAVKIAKVTGESIDDVSKQIDTRLEPTFNKDLEPIDSLDVDTMANVVAGDVTNNVSPKGFLMNVLSNAANRVETRPFFLHLKGLTGGDAGLIQTINTLTDTLKRFPSIDTVKAQAALNAAEFIEDNADMFAKPTVDFIRSFADKFLYNVKDLDKLSKGEVKAITYDMINNSVVSPEGVLISAIAMREVNQRAIDLARVAMTHDTSGIEWGTLLPIFKDLMVSGETWANVFRQHQQLWSTSGVFSQNKFVEGMLSASGLSKFFSNKTIYGTPEELYNITKKGTEDSKYIGDLIDEAIDGDEFARESVRELLAVISLSDPKRPIDLQTLTDDRLKNLFYSGTSELLARSWMSINLLGRLRTASVALMANTVRALTQSTPIASTVGVAVTKLQTDPKVLFKKQTYSDHMALFSGQTKMLAQSAEVFKYALKNNEPIMEGKTRWAGEIKNLSAQARELDEKYVSVWNELNRRDALNSIEGFNLTFSYLFRKGLLNPAFHVVPRTLMATDEGFKVMAGASWANMQASRQALEAGGNLSKEQMKELFDKEIKNVFIDGDPLKGFTLGATEARQYSNWFTFQREITPQRSVENQGPGVPVTQVINNFFRQTESGAENSAVYRWIFPFARMSWEFANQSGAQLVGAIPGGPLLAKLDPDIRATLRGEYGEVAKLTLESNFAQGFSAFWTVAGLAWTGNLIVTSVSNKKGEQSTALVFKFPGSKTVEVGLDKLDPIAVPIGMAASIVNQFRDGHISQGDYNQGMTQIMADMGKLFLDKSILLGLTEATTLLDHKNFNAGWFNSLGNLAGSVVGIGGLRMISDWNKGYAYPTNVSGDNFGNFMRALARRSGVDFMFDPPAFTNPYTGKIQTTRAMVDDPTYWDRVGSGMLGELSAFRVTERDVDDPIIKKVQQFGYEMPTNYLREGDGAVPFESIEQQVIFSEDVFNPKFGDLRGKLNFLFTKDPTYKTLIKNYNSQRQSNKNKPLGNLPAIQTAKEKQTIDSINNLIEEVHKAASRDALMNGRLSNWYKDNKLEAIEEAKPWIQSSLNGATEGLYAQAASQNTPIARQVQAILNLPA